MTDRTSIHACVLREYSFTGLAVYTVVSSRRSQGVGGGVESDEEVGEEEVMMTKMSLVA